MAIPYGNELYLAIRIANYLPREDEVISIDGTTLIVFHPQAHCWQFRLISPGGMVFGERKIYYTAEAALKAGLEWVEQGS